ncbi:MAG: hypothetical protein AAGC55_12965, partial [Myxococcota bacterium]
TGPAPLAGTGNRAMQYTGTALFLVGVGGLGWSAYEANRALRADDEISSAPIGTPWSQSFSDTFERGESSERRAMILAGVGGGLIVAGAIVYWLGRDSSSDRDGGQLAVVPVAEEQSLGVLVSGVF